MCLERTWKTSFRQRPSVPMHNHDYGIRPLATHETSTACAQTKFRGKNVNKTFEISTNLFSSKIPATHKTSTPVRISINTDFPYWRNLNNHNMFYLIEKKKNRNHTRLNKDIRRRGYALTCEHCYIQLLHCHWVVGCCKGLFSSAS